MVRLCCARSSAPRCCAVAAALMDELLKKGLALLKQATDHDAAGQAEKAVSLYLLALDALIKVHGYEKLDINRALLKDKISLYMGRVEVLKASLAPPPTAAASRAASSPALDLSSLPSPPRDPVLPPVPSSAPAVGGGHRRESAPAAVFAAGPPTQEKTVSLAQGQAGVSYASLFGPFLAGAVRVTLEDPFLSAPHQLRNLVAFVEAVCAVNDCYEILIVTRSGGDAQVAALEELRKSLKVGTRLVHLVNCLLFLLP